MRRVSHGRLAYLDPMKARHRAAASARIRSATERVHPRSSNRGRGALPYFRFQRTPPRTLTARPSTDYLFGTVLHSEPDGGPLRNRFSCPYYPYPAGLVSLLRSGTHQAPSGCLAATAPDQESLMGAKRYHQCEQCRYEASVSGGLDSGMCIHVVTITCSDCQEIHDVVLLQRRYVSK